MIDWDCVKDSLLEIVGLGAVTAVIAYLRSRGMEGLSDNAFRRLMQRLVKGFTKKGAARLIPWIGLALLILDIILMIKYCIV